jgi:Uma2 family endonuclease
MKAEEATMHETTAPVLTPPRGSRWGLDGLYYRAEEERTVPLSGAAIRLIFYLYGALRHLLYPRHELVYVAADQFIYYVPHDPGHPVAPDVWVCYGVPKEPERPCFRTWEEGLSPSFVVEISSKDSRGEDRGPKFSIYQDALQCREYLIYDEDLDELLLYRRQGDRFALVPPAADGRVYSEEVEAWFGREPGILVRVYDPEGQPVVNFEEALAHAALAERLRLRAEEERRRAEEAEQRMAEERRRAEVLEAENARLRAELARLQQPEP